jgi:hypothetical protein
MYSTSSITTRSPGHGAITSRLQRRSTGHAVPEGELVPGPHSEITRHSKAWRWRPFDRRCLPAANLQEPAKADSDAAMTAILATRHHGGNTGYRDPKNRTSACVRGGSYGSVA